MGLGGVAAAIGATAAVAGSVSSIVKGSGSGATTAQADAAGDQALAYAREASDLYKNLKAPTFDRTPPQFQSWLQDFSPEVYDPYIGTNTNITDDPASLASEQKALEQLQSFARGGLQPADMIALEQIQRAQAGAATSNGAAAADQLRNRGLGGAGAEYAARLAANQGASNSTASLYDNAMKAAMDRQIAATNSGATLAGNIRNQNVSISKQMADISNAFNSQVQTIRNSAALNAQNTRNSAQAANLAGRQGVANANVTTGNQNIANQNQLNQQDFGNQSTITQGQSNALNRQQTLASANQAALNQQALGQEQAMTAGLNGLAGVAKSFAPATNTNTSGSGSGGSLSGLWNSLTGSSPSYSSLDSNNQSVAPNTWSSQPDEFFLPGGGGYYG